MSYTNSNIYLEKHDDIPPIVPNHAWNLSSNINYHNNNINVGLPGSAGNSVEPDNRNVACPATCNIYFREKIKTLMIIEVITMINHTTEKNIKIMEERQV